MKKKISFKSASDIRSHQAQQIPEDVSNQLDAWIAAGEKKNKTIAITQNNSQNVVDISGISSTETPSDKNVRLNINLSGKTHHSLKLACLQKNMTITDFIKQLIESELKRT